MEKKKSNLGMFLIIIPLLGVFLAFWFDNSLIFIENRRLGVVTKEIIEDCFTINVNDYYKKVKEDYEKEKITTDHLSVTFENDSLHIYNSHSYPSFFGQVFGVKSYRSEINLRGSMSNGTMSYEEVKDE